LLSFRGISTPSLPAQGEQRRSSYFNIPRGNSADRVQKLAARNNATVRLRFVLPMVMRGLPVPRAKQIYILRDAKREAERLGMPFGRVVDPVGRGVERGLAVLHHAIAAGRGAEFVESFLRGAFAEGIDATPMPGCRR
jgi:2-hydroxychromene-2-carboxylate isomerase